MANASGNSKQLTASVRLNTTQFENKLKRISRAIDVLNNAVNKQSNAYDAVINALNSTERQTGKVKAQTEKVTQEVKKTKLEQDKFTTAVSTLNSKLNNTKSIFSGIGSLVKRIAGTLLGIGTIKLAIQGADTLTGAENRLNNIAGRQLGDAAYTFDSSGNKTGYSEAAKKFSQDAMNKMYVAAQNSRSLYSDMMANVSKTMTLAPAAFQDNIDYAIRFQEIMAKAYTVGGASAQEMSTSMYQLTQALGSGILQGDELRSVREGAPLAYQAIEKYAQGVLAAAEAEKGLKAGALGSSESLKDLASDGLITSEMVVAAVMNMGDSIDDAFALTKWRFSEVWDSIKSSAQRAFQPVVSMLTDILNNAVANGLIEKAQVFFTNLAKAAMIAMKVIENVFDWIVNNWETVKNALIAGLIAITTWHISLKVVSLITWITINKEAIKLIATYGAIAAAIASIIYAYYLWQTGAINTTQFIITCIGIIAGALLILGLIHKSVVLGVLGLVFAAIALIGTISSNLCDFITNLAWGIANAIVVVLLFIAAAYMATGALLLSIPTLIALTIIALLAVLLAAFFTYTGEIIGGALGIWEVIKEVCSWIGSGWSNMCNDMKAGWWNAIADMLEGVDWLLKGINGIRKVLGLETVSVESFRAKADEYAAKVVDHLDISGAWDTGYSRGYAIGTGIQNKINAFGDQIKQGTELPTIDDLAEQLGVDFAGKFDFPTEESVGGAVGHDYQPDNNKLLGNIDDNTGKMADSMKLTEEDLEYLRRVADMEWKKEFTTANIMVDMTNNNTVSGTNDLDGIVTYLSEKLYEEMDAIAHGVYA